VSGFFKGHNHIGCLVKSQAIVRNTQGAFPSYQNRCFHCDQIASSLSLLAMTCGYRFFNFYNFVIASEEKQSQLYNVLAQACNEILNCSGTVLIDDPDGLAADNRDVGLAAQEVNIPAVLNAKTNRQR